MGATMGKSSHMLPFNIFATDYENFDILYSCTQYTGFHFEMFSLSARTPQISKKAYEAAKAVIADKLSMVKTYQELETSSLFAWTKQGPKYQCKYDWKFQSLA